MGYPDLGREEAKAVYDQIISGWISQGRKTIQFEEDIASYTDSEFSVAMANGTVTLHAMLRSIGIEKGDLVLVPSLTYISSVNVIYLCNAIPLYCDVDPETLLLDISKLEKSILKYKPKAVMSVDLKGMPCDYDSINTICEESGVVHIADSAESLGATYKNKKVGSQALMHSFSLFANKTITTGEGGLVTTNSHFHEQNLRLLRNQAQGTKRYEHIEMGYNYRFTDIKAALGVSQVRRLESILELKGNIVSKLKSGLENKLRFQQIPSYVTRHSYYNLTCIFDNKVQRNRVQKGLNEANIETRISFPPCHLQPHHKNLQYLSLDELPSTVNAYSTMLDIPCHQNLSDDDVERITKSILDNL